MAFDGGEEVYITREGKGFRANLCRKNMLVRRYGRGIVVLVGTKIQLKLLDLYARRIAC